MQNELIDMIQTIVLAVLTFFTARNKPKEK